MFINKVKEILDLLALELVEVGKAKITVRLPVPGMPKFIKGPTYQIYLPIPSEDGSYIDYGNRCPNTKFAVMERKIEEGSKLHPAEAVYLQHVNRMDLMEPIQGEWIAKKGFVIASGRKLIDQSFPCCMSDMILIELFRGLTLDKRRFEERPGSRGFAATNGSMLSLMSKYSSLGVRRENDWVMWRNRIMFNRAYDLTVPAEMVDTTVSQTSQYVDLAAVPQDTTAVVQAQMIDGVEIQNHQFVKTKPAAFLSQINSSVPFIKTMAARRLVVARARYQALGMHQVKEPILKVEGAYELPGMDALCLRSKEDAPPDTFIMSQSFSKKFKGVEKVEHTYTVPCRTKFELLIQPAEKELTEMSLAMGVAKNTVRRGKAIMTYYRPAAATESIEEAIANHEQVTIRSAHDYLPTEIVVEHDVTYRKLPVTQITVHGYSITEAKHGTKIMDRFGNKGTVRIVPDHEMPVVNIDGEERLVDVLYSPSIFKRKIGFAVRMEEILTMYGNSNEVELSMAPDSGFEDGWKLAKEHGMQRMFTVRYPDGTVKKRPVGFHYLHHLNHDPKAKFSFSSRGNGPKQTIIDKLLYRELGLKVGKEDFSEALIVAKALGYTLDTRGNVPVLIEGAKPVEEDCVEITRKLDRDYLNMELHLVPKKELENTVADPRFWKSSTYGFIRTPKGTVFVPPNLLKPIIGHDNSLVLTTELHLANSIVSEVDGYKRAVDGGQEGRGVGIAKKIETRIGLLQRHLVRRLALYTRNGFFPRMSGFGGVVIVNNKLGVDEVGIPKVMAKKFMQEGQLALVRRHPIHRKYCTPVMRVRGMDEQYVIQLNEKVLTMMSGDSDGDLVEIVPVTGTADQHHDMMPAHLLTMWQEMSGKKVTTKDEVSAELGWAQYALKTLVALSGAVSIRLGESSMEKGIGLEETMEVYYAMAQRALNVKHSRDDFRLNQVQEISKALLSTRKDYAKAAKLIVDYMGWQDTEHAEVIKKLLESEPIKDLGLVRKRIPANLLSDLSESEAFDHVSDELSVIQSDALVAEAAG